MKKFTFILLWLVGIFGMLGLHRFYLGYKGAGVLWLLTFGFFLIGSFYDIFNINKLIAKSEGKEYIPENENLYMKKTTKKSIGRTIRYILIYQRKTIEEARNEVTRRITNNSF